MKVLKFGAVWCPGCLVMKPLWKEIETEHPWLKTEFYDYDKDKGMVEKYEIKTDTLPAFVFLDAQEQEFLRLNGEVEKEKLISIILEHRND